MSCQETDEFIHAYLDGELDLGRSLEVEQHMHECEICELIYVSQTTLRSSLKNDSLYYAAPDKLKRRVQSALRKEAKSEVPQRAFGWRVVASACSKR